MTASHSFHVFSIFKRLNLKRVAFLFIKINGILGNGSDPLIPLFSFLRFEKERKSLHEPPHLIVSLLWLPVTIESHINENQVTSSIPYLV